MIIMIYLQYTSFFSFNLFVNDKSKMRTKAFYKAEMMMIYGIHFLLKINVCFIEWIKATRTTTRFTVRTFVRFPISSIHFGWCWRICFIVIITATTIWSVSVTVTIATTTVSLLIFWWWWRWTKISLCIISWHHRIIIMISTIWRVAAVYYAWWISIWRRRY